MKILLLGKNGQLGWELQRSLAPLGELIALDRQGTEHCGDLADLQGLARTVQALRPDVIVNAAAYTGVDKAESNSALAHLVNAAAPAMLAKQAGELGACMVHYSTDYVFDGSGTRPWQEDDTPAPLNVYGQSKLDGERLVAANCRHHLILRTSWVYATRGNNFAKSMLRLAQQRESLDVICDQWGAPTGADLLADITAHALHQLQHRPQDAGIYHATAQGETNWYEYAKHVLAQARLAMPTANFLAKEVRPVSTQAYGALAPVPAQRPLNSRMDTARLQNTFGLALPAWRTGVDRMLAELGALPALSQ